MKHREPLQIHLRRSAQICATATVILAVMNLVLWSFGEDALRLLPNLVPAAPSVALALLILSLSLLVFSLPARGRFAVAAVGGALVLVLSMARIAEFVFRTDFGVDSWIVSLMIPEAGQTLRSSMALSAAVALLLASAAMLLFAWSARSRFFNSLAAGISVVVSFMGLVFCLAYAFGSPLMERGSRFPMMLNSALGLFILGAGCVAAAASRETGERQASRRRQRAQHEVTRILAATEEPGPAVHLALEAVCRELRCDYSAVWRLGPDGVLRCRHVWHRGSTGLDMFEDVSRELLFNQGDGLPGKAAKEQKPVWVADVTQTKDFVRAAAALESGLRGGFCGPMIVGNEMIGCFEVFSEEPLDADDEILATLQDLAGQIGQYLRRKDAEEVLRQSEQRTRLIIETANDAFIEADAHGLITDWNRQAENIFGWTRTEVLGKKLADFALPSRDNQARAVLDEMLRTGTSPILNKRIEARMLRRDGSEFPAELTVWRIDAGGVLRYNAFFRDITERKRAEEQLAAKTAEMEQELEIAREFQEALLPHDYPQVPSAAALDPLELHFHHFYKPAFTVGGDFFDVVKLSDHRAGIFIADVMGHGARSALITAILRTLLQDLAPQTDDPGKFLELLNRHYMDIVERSHQFVFASAFYLIADTETGMTWFASAGHPSPLVADRQGRRVGALLDYGANGPALGFLRDAAYDTYTRPIKSGDLFVLFTDGIVEATNRALEEFGYERFCRVIEEKLDAQLDDLTRGVVEAVQRFTDFSAPSDDLCLVTVEVTGHASPVKRLSALSGELQSTER